MRIARWRSMAVPGRSRPGDGSFRPHLRSAPWGGADRRRREIAAHCVGGEKLKHDSDLFRNLPPRVRDGHKFETLARIYDSVAADLGKALVELSGEQLETLGPDYNTALHLIDAPEIFSGAVNPDLDGAAIQAAWSRDSTCLVTIDDLLTPRALALIQRFERVHNLARFHSYRWIRRDLSGRRLRLPAGAADRRRIPCRASWAARSSSADPGMGV